MFGQRRALLPAHYHPLLPSKDEPSPTVGSRWSPPAEVGHLWPQGLHFLVYKRSSENVQSNTFYEKMAGVKKNFFCIRVNMSFDSIFHNFLKYLAVSESSSGRVWAIRHCEDWWVCGGWSGCCVRKHLWEDVKKASGLQTTKSKLQPTRRNCIYTSEAKSPAPPSPPPTITSSCVKPLVWMKLLEAWKHTHPKINTNINVHSKTATIAEK